MTTEERIKEHKKELTERQAATATMVAMMLAESAKRMERIEAKYDPVTGDGLQWMENPITHENLYNRKKVTIPDHIIPVQWMPEEMLQNALVQSVTEYGSIAEYIRQDLGMEPTTAIVGEIQLSLLEVRRQTDPIYWFGCEWAIKPKYGGMDIADDDEFDEEEEEQKPKKTRRGDYTLIPFVLNYGQLILLSWFEALRLANSPILVVVLKARQWGASTLTQCYFAWIQLNLKTGWYSVIVAQTASSSNRIKMMYQKGIGQYDPALLGIKDRDARLRFSPYGLTKSDFQVVWGPMTKRNIARDISISIGTYENPDNMPGADISLVHYSEVALWKETNGKKPEDIIKSITGGLKKGHLTMEVLESTPRGSGNFFQRAYDDAKNGESSRHAVFIPWFFILNDTLPLKDREAFAEWLYKNRNLEDCPTDIPEHKNKRCLNSGKYLWNLWKMGATLEGIHWYVMTRLGMPRQQDMASEAPSDDIEAFLNTDNLAFDLYDIQRMREKYEQRPRFVGDIYSDYGAGSRCLEKYAFEQRQDGRMFIWKKPEYEHIRDRYLVVVDIGGEWKKADWSVIRVFDRKAMMDEGKEETVLMWSGHVPHDHLGWKAVQVAKWYDNALLVFESNTLEQRDQNRQVDEGDQLTYILEAIDYCYDNLYVRSNQRPDELGAKKVVRYGFHTNKQTKPDIVNILSEVIRNCDYVERDEETLVEFQQYVRNEGRYEALVGKHDDRLMTAGIGLYISRRKMDKPRYIQQEKPKTGYYTTTSLAGF